MSEREPGTTHNNRSGSPERMARTAGRYENWIAEGISAAREASSEIDLMTARLIAHTLGRATGRTSALANFGRTGDGDYEALRDEYLALYSDPTSPPLIREWIDWFGTHLVQREQIGSGRRFMNEHQAPQLDRLLVRADLALGEQHLSVHVPASTPRDAIDQLAGTLRELGVDGDEAMQAFLSLPDVNALTDDLTAAFSASYVDTFDRLEDAVHGLMEVDEWEKDINEYAHERGFFVEGVTPDYEVLIERVRDAYDLVEWKGAVHAFYT
ncbi:MAG: hypothetical protein KF727_09925 [Microbacteriaceae bacterium]|nr:hypothetical protein [Microbacteriaceae bacterium]